MSRRTRTARAVMGRADAAAATASAAGSSSSALRADGRGSASTGTGARCTTTTSGDTRPRTSAIVLAISSNVARAARPARGAALGVTAVRSEDGNRMRARSSSRAIDTPTTRMRSRVSRPDRGSVPFVAISNAPICGAMNAMASDADRTPTAHTGPCLLRCLSFECLAVLPQVPNDRREALDGVVDVLLRGEPAEPEAYRRGRNRIGAHDGTEDVRRRPRGRTAGRSGGDRDVAARDEQRLAIDGLEADVQVVRQPMRHRAIDDNAPRPGLEPGEQPIAQRADARGIGNQVLARQSTRRAQPDDAGHVERAGAQAALVA